MRIRRILQKTTVNMYFIRQWKEVCRMKSNCLWFVGILALALVTPQGYCGGGVSAETIVIGAGSGYVWSPTGDRLAFVSNDTVFTYNVDSGARKAIGRGAAPHWSPTGFLAFASGDSLIVFDNISARSASAQFGSGFGFSWSGDQTLIVIVSRPDTIPTESLYRCQLHYLSFDQATSRLVRDSTIMRDFRSLTRPILESVRGLVLIKTRSANVSRVALNSPSITYRGDGSRFFAVESHVPEIHVGGGKLWNDTDIWLFDADGVAVKRINPPNDSFFPSLSPNGLLILVTDVRGHTVVFDTSGNQVADVPQACGGAWSPDSRYIVFERTLENGDDIIGGDIFQCDIATNTVQQLTNTPDAPELYPFISPDGRWLGYNAINGKGLTLMRLGERDE